MVSKTYPFNSLITIDYSIVFRETNILMLNYNIHAYPILHLSTCWGLFNRQGSEFLPYSLKFISLSQIYVAIPTHLDISGYPRVCSELTSVYKNIDPKHEWNMQMTIKGYYVFLKLFFLITSSFKYT